MTAPQAPGAPEAVPTFVARPVTPDAPKEQERTKEPAAQPKPKPEAPKKSLSGSTDTPPWGSDEDFNAEKAWKLIQNLRSENKAAAVQDAAAEATKQARADLAQQIGKALGIVQDDETPDPVKLTEQLTAQTAAAKQAQLELAVHRAASTAGVDANALLDSRSFVEKVKDLDPNDGTALQAAIGEAATANPVFAQRLAPNPAQGASGVAAPGLDEQIAAAMKAGDTGLAIALKAQKLAPTGR